MSSISAEEGKDWTHGPWQQFDDGGRTKNTHYHYGSEYASAVWGPEGPGHGVVCKCATPCTDVVKRVPYRTQAIANARLCAGAPELYDMVESLTEALARSDNAIGICCCGAEMLGHSLYDGHSPTDAGTYHAEQLIEAAMKLMAKCRGVHDE